MTTPVPVPTGVANVDAAPVAGPLSRTSPIAGAMSMQSPTGPVPVGDGFGPKIIGPGGESPLMQRGSARAASTFADPAAALRAPASGQQSPSAVVQGSHLVWQNLSAGWRSIWIMNGAAWANQASYLPTISTDWQIAAAADFSGDGNADLLWQNVNAGWRSIWIMDGPTWGGQAAYLPTVAPEWRIAGAADFNADGSPDIVWQNTLTGDRSIWLMNRTTYTGTTIALPNVPKEWSIVAVDDFNADGKPDLVWQNLSISGRSIWFMNGTSWTGQAAYLPTIGPDWSIVAAADFNSDGKSDLVWQNTQAGWRSIWLMNGSTWNGQYSALPQVSVDWSIAAAGNFTNGPVPAAPTNLAPSSFVSSSPSQITLSWTRGASANETSTEIERATWAASQNSSPSNPIQWTTVGTVGAGVTTFTNTGLSAATRYVYRARACNASGCSSAALAITTAETAPLSITPLTLGTPAIAAPTSQGSSRWFQVTLPAGRSTFTVQTSAGSGESDLYVRYNSLNGTTGGCSSALTGTTESCTINTPAGGTYYIQLFGRNAYSNVNVVAN
jgi:hypothetical protein